MKKRLLSVLAGLMPLAFACADGAGSGEPAPDEAHAPLPAGKGDQWGPADDPTIFDGSLEYRLAELPKDGEAAAIPWAGSYWPVFEDSINVRWDGAGSSSAAEKYGKAFGIEGLEDVVSKGYGIDAHADRKACKVDSDCEEAKGEGCAKRHGKEEGRCIPTWWGICHAWAPASILEPEPVHPVVRNGVTFEVNDLKALVSLVYDRASSKFLSLRCDKDEQSGGIGYDRYGSPGNADLACKDTNPGTYFVLLANYLGLKGQSFVEDRTFDDEVWNQPLSGYRVTKMVEVSAPEANALVGFVPASPEGALSETVNGSVAKDGWFHSPKSFPVPKGGKAKVVMTGEGDPDLYVRLGEAPTAEKWDCRPYVGGASELCEVGPVAEAKPLFVAAHGYEASSAFTFAVTVETGATETPATYLFNPKAAKLYDVTMEVDYIGESASTVDGNLSGSIAQYRRTDVYTFVLEVDQAGKVAGGEWTGASKKAHPDFLWLPTGRKSTPIAGGKITYELVKSLLDESVAGPKPGVETVVTKEAGSVSKGKWAHFGPFEAGAGAFEVVMTGTGDADLYVRKGAKPTKTKYDCRPYQDGSSETCTLEGPGAFYVSVFGYQASKFELTITWRKPGAAAPAEPPPVAHLSVTGTVAEGQLAVHSLAVQAGRKVVVTTTAAGDVDLYLKLGLAPTTSTFDLRAWTESGNETLVFTPTANGILFVGVHGYEASPFTLTTTDG